jgi:hypothetical protein
MVTMIMMMQQLELFHVFTHVQISAMILLLADTGCMDTAAFECLARHPYRTIVIGLKIYFLSSFKITLMIMMMQG